MRFLHNERVCKEGGGQHQGGFRTVTGTCIEKDTWCPCTAKRMT